MPSESPLLLRVKCSKGRKWSDFYYLQNAIAKGCGHHQELRKCLSDEVVTEVWLLAQAQKATRYLAWGRVLLGAPKRLSLLSLHMSSHQRVCPGEEPTGDGNTWSATGPRLHQSLSMPEMQKQSEVMQSNTGVVPESSQGTAKARSSF